jgi:YidC/Oxa1 family membrane protein insertase
MEGRNVIAAITMSAAVIILWSLYFSPSPEEAERLKTQQEEKQLVQETESPKIEQEEKSESVSREESILQSDRINFENEFIKGSIALNNGGAIDDFKFKNYNKTLNSKEKIILLNPSNTKNGYLLNTGWTTNSEVEVPNSNTVWIIESGNKLTPKNPIKIYFENNVGVRFERTITLDEKYLFTIKQKIINNSNKNYKFYPYAFLHRNNIPEDLTDFYILHEGFVTVGDGELEEVDYDDVEEKKFTIEASTGFVSLGDKYWLTSLIPNQGRKFRIDIDYKKKYRASFIDLEGFNVDANSSAQHTVRSVIGAKEVKLIDKYAEELNIKQFDLNVSYGIFYWIVRPMHVALNYLYKFSGNYGYAIILLTILIRIIFFPLNQYSFKSMSKMKVLAPQLNIVKEKWKEDKVQLQKETMKLYKANGVNPMSSCFPILLQIPIFFSLYKLLLLDIAMRHAPFVWYWQDLSAKDSGGEWLFSFLPFNIPSFLEIGLLPVLMGVSMWATQKLNPMPGGTEAAEMQKKIFTWFPVFIVFILAPFASGLCLYWCCTNCLQFLQQWFILRKTTVKALQ